MDIYNLLLYTSVHIYIYMLGKMYMKKVMHSHNIDKLHNLFIVKFIYDGVIFFNEMYILSRTSYYSMNMYGILMS